MRESDADLQRRTCEKHGATFVPAPRNQKVGIAENVTSNVQPINGLRHRPVGDTCGWYIWSGDSMSDAADFFTPLHVEHLDDICPKIKKYLGLAPGWRFLIADGHEDVWFDATLLNE